MLDGNVPIFDLFAGAAGEATWVDAEVSLVAMDGVSTVDASAVTAV